MTESLLKMLKKLPKTSGIYFVYDGPVCLYVGQARNLKERWAGHHRKEQIAQKYPDANITWLNAQESELDTLEKKYIQELEPRLNGRRIIQDRPLSEEESAKVMNIINKLGTSEGDQAFLDFFTSFGDTNEL